MQAEVIRRIPHLQPPCAMAQARPDRGSPMFEEPSAHSIAFLRPSACYRYIYHRPGLRRGEPADGGPPFERPVGQTQLRSAATCA
jgi:hypothetical protein